MLVLLVISSTLVVHSVHRGHEILFAVWALLVTVAVTLVLLKARMYAMKVQDRVIRLEERLRLSALMSENLRARIQELSEDQLIGLRFASDAEVVELATQAIEQHLTRKQIKDRIRNWRADYWRV